MEKRNLTRSGLVFILSLFLFSGQMFAQSFSSTDPSIAIPDDAYDGSTVTMAAMPISVSGIGTISDISVDVTMNHTWVGDLVIKLEAPDGTIIGLLSRPSLAEGVDDGTGCCGESANLSSASPITYSDAGVAPAEDLANTLGTDEFACADDGFCNYTPSPDAIGGFTTFADFAAAVGTGNGTWTLYVGDSAGGDTGSLDAVTLNITASGGGTPGGGAVPTMSEWGLFMFFLVTLNLGMVFMYKMEAQKDLAIAGGSASTSFTNNLPFEMNAFKTAMKHALGLSVVGFAIILLGWGEIVALDLIGMAIAIPMVAYLIQTINLMKK